MVLGEVESILALLKQVVNSLSGILMMVDALGQFVVFFPPYFSL